MSKPSSDFEADIGKKYTVGKVTVVIENVLAEGGFGVVFLARSNSSQKYALKRLYVNEESKLNACKREIQIMSSLSNHKNMVTFVESSTTRNYKGVWEVLILMHYYSGTCMKIVNDRGSAGLKEGEILKIFCDVCEAVSRLHHCQTPILHRDLKIENILCDSDNSYVLCDFGSATARVYIPGKDERTVTEVEDDVNKHTTLSHRAPEMVNLYGHKSITTKADIWALGITLYRLCFRALPFGESTLAIQNANLTIPEGSQYSKGLHSLLCYCLETDPDVRPDIFQVSYVAFLLANRKCPIKNIHSSPLPDINSLIELMLRRTSKNASAMTPKSSDRNDRMETTTTITPRERPRRQASQRTAPTVPLATNPVQRRLIPENNGVQHQTTQAIPTAQQLQQAGYTQEQQQYILQQHQQKLEQQRLYQVQQQQAQLQQQLTPEQKQQLLQQQQQHAQQQQQLTPEQQQQLLQQQQQQNIQLTPDQISQLQQHVAKMQLLAQQQQLSPEQQHQLLQRQHLLQHQLSLQQQQITPEQRLAQEQHLAQQQLMQQQALYEQQLLIQRQQQQLAAQQAAYEQHLQQEQYKQQQLEQQRILEQQQQLAAQQQQLAEQQALYQQLLQQQQYHMQQQQIINQGPTQLSEVPTPQPSTVESQPESEAPVVHAFDDDFSQAVLFEADFSQANFHPPVTSADTEPVDSDSTPTMTDSGDTVVSEAKPATKDSEDIAEEKATTAEFKVPPIPDVKSKLEVSSKKLSDRLTPPLSKPYRKHRRNASDTSAISIGRHSSAFKVYSSTTSKSAKQLTASLGSLTSITSGDNASSSASVGVVRSRSEATSLSDANYNSQSMKASSVEALHSQNHWNPFAAQDDDTISDDVMFGQEFDRLRCGSQSSIQNVKSREDLVMLENGSTADPFGAAPFNAKSKSRKRDQKLAEKYSRLSAAASDENLLSIEKIQNQTIFGVPIPFTRKSDRTDKYHKVPTDSDNGDQSSDEESLEKTLKSSQYKRMENEHSSNSGSSNSGTLTRNSQLPTDPGGEDVRPQSCDSNYSGTVTPPASSNENLADPFGAAPFTADQKGMNGLAAVNNGIKVESCPVPLLPNNPFLSDIIHGQSQSTVQSQSNQSLEKLSDKVSIGERNREPSFSDFATARKTVEPLPPSSQSLHDFQSIQQSGDVGFGAIPAPVPNGAQGTVTLPRMQKSKTIDGFQPASGDNSATNRLSQNLEPLLRRSNTDYEVGVKVNYDNDEDDLSDSETLLSEKNMTGSLRKKDKGRKSPRTSKSSKSPRHSDSSKRSLSYADGNECQGALTNAAFSEQDTTPVPPAISQPPTTAPKPQIVQPHPPTTPKPSSERRPPIAAKPKTKTTPEQPKTTSAADIKTPIKQGIDLKSQSKSETKAPQGSAAKDPYKTHKRYSSYDLATGRAELSICTESDNSKSALVGKEGKSKKKGKMGLGIF